jgi:hypothetical protein
MTDIHDSKGSGHTNWVDQEKEHSLPEGQSYDIPLGTYFEHHDAQPGRGGLLRLLDA